MPTSVKRQPKRPPTAEERRTAAEAARKELATQFLHDFVMQAWHVIEPEEEFTDNWHINAICDHLESVTEGRIPQLLINVPPGTMKSLLVCVFWCAWVWATKPGKRFMYSSYAESLSLRDSIKTRTLIRSDWYQKRWPTLMMKDTDHEFHNEAGGWRMVGSISGRGIGEHPDFQIADDPHNVLQAESEAERSTVTRWFEGVFCIRGVVRDAKRVLVMQRLHAMDCSGVALSKGGWTHICLPMKYEATETRNMDGKDIQVTKVKVPTVTGFMDPRETEGELLWPAKYPAEKVANLEINLGLYNAAGQLQQRPSPRGGGKFKREWFGTLLIIPQTIKNLVRYWDKAGTAGGTGAQTSGTLMGQYRDDAEVLPVMKEKFVILDILTCRLQAAGREATIKQTAELDRAKYGHVEVWVEQEPGSGGKESAEGTVGNLVGFTCNVERVTGSKEVRADPLASQASVGKVKVLPGNWTPQFLDEIEMFPMGKLKDMVDSTSGAFNKLCAPGGGICSVSDFGTGKPVDEPDAGMAATFPVMDSNFFG